MKAKVYVETLMISNLTARPTNDLHAANQNAAVDWWEAERLRYD